MNPTLTELIKNALDTKLHYEAEWEQHCPNAKLLEIYQENEQLALNCLEERISEMIESRIQTALANFNPNRSYLP